MKKRNVLSVSCVLLIVFAFFVLLWSSRWLSLGIPVYYDFDNELVEIGTLSINGEVVQAPLIMNAEENKRAELKLYLLLKELIDNDKPDEVLDFVFKDPDEEKLNFFFENMKAGQILWGDSFTHSVFNVNGEKLILFVHKLKGKDFNVLQFVRFAEVDGVLKVHFPRDTSWEEQLISNWATMYRKEIHSLSPKSKFSMIFNQYFSGSGRVDVSSGVSFLYAIDGGVPAFVSSFGRQSLQQLIEGSRLTLESKTRVDKTLSRLSPALRERYLAAPLGGGMDFKKMLNINDRYVVGFYSKLSEIEMLPFKKNGDSWQVSNLLTERYFNDFFESNVFEKEFLNGE